MSQQDHHIMRSVKQLAQKECANYANGFCVYEDRPCHVLNAAYKPFMTVLLTVTISCTLSCRWIWKQTKPYGMKSIGRKGRQEKAGKIVFAAISPSFQPATASDTALLAEKLQSKQESGKNSAAIGNARKGRPALPFRTKKV